MSGSDDPSQEAFTRRYNQNDIDPDEIFRAFFGGGFPAGGPGVRMYSFGGGGRRVRATSR